jgi:hypothetical protein
LSLEVFSWSRDFLYLTGILLGISAGLFLNYFKKRLSRAQKNRRITAGIFIISAAFLSAASAVILSNGDILRDSAVLIAACCIMTAGIPAMLFPEIFLFPVIVLSGVCVILTSYIFLRYPQISGSVTITEIARTEDTILIKPEYPKFARNYNKSIDSSRARYENYYNNARPFTLEYSSAIVTINRLTPLIGGQRRCVLRSLNLVDDKMLRLRLYFPSYLEDIVINSLLLYDGVLITVKSFFSQTELSGFEPYTNYRICFDGTEIYRMNLTASESARYTVNKFAAVYYPTPPPTANKAGWKLKFPASHSGNELAV